MEVLVALTVLGLSMGLLLKTFSTSLAGAARSEEHSQAVLLAQSQLARVGSEFPLRSGERSGQWENSYRWQIRIGKAEAWAIQGAPYPLYRVVVSVHWKAQGRHQTFRLRTLRLGRLRSKGPD